MESVAHYVFIDQQKKRSVVGVGDERGHKQKKFAVERDEMGQGRLKKEPQGLNGKVVVGLEATSFYDWMADLPQDEIGVEVKLGHPPAMKYISKAKNKTDGKDVERGLKLLGTEQFPEAYLPTPQRNRPAPRPGAQHDCRAAASKKPPAPAHGHGMQKKHRIPSPSGAGALVPQDAG